MNENYFTNALILLVQIVKIAGPDRQKHKNYYTNTLILLVQTILRGKFRAALTEVEPRDGTAVPHFARFALGLELPDSPASNLKR